MWIESLKCKNFRNYKDLFIKFDPGVNFLYGNNAQGKTNILEAVCMCSMSRSYRGAKDREVILFGEDEAHLSLVVIRKEISHRIDIHIKKNKSKGIAINGFPIKKASELLGYLKLVIFSPEDLFIVKNGPSERRKFIDSQLCQISSLYMKNLSVYNKILNNRNRVLKDIVFNDSLESLLDVLDEQLTETGNKIFIQREEFFENLNEIINPVHRTITGNLESMVLKYEPGAEKDRFFDQLKTSRKRDISHMQTMCGPHRDDFCVISNGVDLRKFGSQGQIRSAALSLKLSEIEMIRKMTRETPVLLLDDVFSELDSQRQEYLLSEINETQNILTGTGFFDFREKLKINRLFCVKNGKVTYGESN